jgi:hypothetical protein
MRTTLAVSFGIVIGAATLLLLLATYCSTGREHARPIPADLPDLIRRDSEEQKRSFLIREARRQLAYITHKFDDTLLARANCEVAESRLEQDYESADAAPLMIAASLVPLGELVPVAKENEYFFFVWCFNPHREDDGIVLVGRTPEGTTVRIRYDSKPSVKCGALVGTFAGKTRLVSVDELLQEGTVFRRNGEIEVFISTETTGAPVVPDLPVLAVAVHDRNGKLSNFVPVCRDKAVNEDRRVIETVRHLGERSSGDDNHSPK